jgi:hypothetical protein
MFKEKLEELLIEAGSKIRRTRGALEYTVGMFRPLRSGATLDMDALARESEIVWVGQPGKKEKRTTFGKEYKKAMDDGADPALDLLRDEIELIKLGRITPESREIKDAVKVLGKAISGIKGYRLSYDYDTFMRELHYLTLLFVFTKGEIKEVNDLALEALPHAGKLIGQIEAEGKARSDLPTKAGRTEWKGKIGKQEVIEEAYRIDTNGKTKNAICEGIRAALIKRGVKKKAVYSTKSINNILKDEWTKIL